ncbi:MAG: hypothetical protein F4Z18_15930 [Caldilineaceae bacterium SB0666_bin_21]|nr:hypothetical protein [Caldilineaceae bacterium SB0666_bin_21]
MATNLRLDEKTRQQFLLSHLRLGTLTDIPPHLLLKPRRGTLPFMQLVAHYPKVWQIFSGRTSLFGAIAVLALVGFLRDRLGMLLDPSWIESVPTWVDSNLASELSYLSIALISLGLLLMHMILVLGLFVLFPLYLLGKLIFAWNTLSLDLNGLHHASTDGLPYTPWRDVHGIDPDKLRWIRVKLKNGILLRLRVPRADRDWLVKAMRQLLRHHYGDLHGQMLFDDRGN